MKEFFGRLISTLGVIIAPIPPLADRYKGMESFSLDLFRWYDFIFIFALIASTAWLLFDIHHFILNKDKIFSYDEKGKKKIAKYLNKKISNSQKVAIFSRDLTWVSKDSEQYKTLSEKSKHSELILFLEKDTDISRYFASSGAKVKKYSFTKSKEFNPKIRFTILNYGLSGKQALIGFKDEQGKHIIRSINFKEHPEILDLIDDYISFLSFFTKG